MTGLGRGGRLPDPNDTLSSAAPARLALLVGDADGELWGMTTTERHRRITARMGIEMVLPWGGSHAERLLLLRRDFAFDDNLLQALTQAPDRILMAADAEGVLRPVAANVEGEAAAGVAAMIRVGRIDQDTLPPMIGLVEPEGLGPKFNRKLRKRARPYACQVTPATRAAVEWRTFREVYKGATDLVTKYVWPVPAFHVTRWCARHRLTPNVVTSVSALLMLLATWLFWQGHLLPGLIPAWGMTFLDTVDGKLARTTMTSSRWGNLFDHGVDLLHPPFWWLAWWHGIVLVDRDAATGPLWTALMVILGGYVVLRLLEGAFKLLFRIQPHIWRPIDYHFRAITSRRNPNLAILSVAICLGNPAAGLLLVAAWTVLSCAFHLVRIAQASWVRLTGGRIVSWLSELALQPATAPAGLESGSPPAASARP
jgi:phosphatidylglycerophosphate synthase